MSATGEPALATKPSRNHESQHHLAAPDGQGFRCWASSTTNNGRYQYKLCRRHNFCHNMVTVYLNDGSIPRVKPKAYVEVGGIPAASPFTLVVAGVNAISSSLAVADQ